MDDLAQAQGLPNNPVARMASAISQCGIGAQTVVLNAFGPAYGALAELAAKGLAELGARQVSAQDLLDDEALLATAFVGSPDRLFALCRSGYGQVMTHALVGGGAVFPLVHTVAAQHGIAMIDMMVEPQFGPYALRDKAEQAYQIPEGVELSIMRPGAMEALPHGMVGEVVLDDAGLAIRTGVLSAWEQVPHRYRQPGLQGWMGFAVSSTGSEDQKVSSTDLARLVDEHQDLLDARLVRFVKDKAEPVLQIETEAGDWIEDDVLDSFEKRVGFRPQIERITPGALPNTGRSFSLRAA